MAVAESATRAGGGSGSARGERATAGAAPPSPPGLGWHALARAFALAFPLWLSAGAHAQLIADPAAPTQQRPTVHSAANGVPLVHIQAPSAAGVSHNRYRQFDVSASGAILNNSRSHAPTQLGGWVQGNPWLATGAARIVLNEVRSSEPSQLGGPVEVAGQRAQVIIANPAGIQVQGGSFINASRAVLTTGTPLMREGALEGYRVQGGTIRIGGAGLDASGTDYTAILARAVEVNAGLWARQLDVVTGVNDASADLDHISLQVAPQAGAPAFALDVAQLGGMYAGQIHLVGTESGVGVNLRGVVGATAGELVLDTSGWLHQQGTLQASEHLRVQAQGSIHNEGSLYAGKDLAIATQAGLANRGRLDAQGRLDLQAPRLENHAGARIASNADLQAVVDGRLDNQGEIVAGGELRLRADALDNHHGGRLQAQRLDIGVRSLDNTQGTVWQTGAQALQLELGHLDNRRGQIGHSLLGAGTEPGAGTGAGTGAPGSGTANPGTPEEGTTAPEQDASPAPPPPAPGTIRVTGTAVNTDGVLAAEGLIGATVRDGLINSGSILAERIDVLGAALDNAGGQIRAREALLNTVALDNTGGRIEARQLGVQAERLDNTRGVLGAEQALHIAASERLDNTQGQIQSTHAGITIEARRLHNAEGAVHAAGGALQVQAGEADNSGQMHAAGELRLQVQGGLAHSGAITAQGDATITARSLDSTGALASQGDLHVNTADTLRAGGQHLAVGQATFTGGALDLRGSQSSAHNLTLHATAGDIHTQGATVVAAGTLAARADASAGQKLVNTGGTLSAGRLQLDLVHLDNAQGTLVQTGDADTTIALRTAGQTEATGTLDNTGGLLATQGALALQVGALHNGAQGRIVAAGQASLNVAGTLDNAAGGQILAVGALALRAQDLVNTAGQLLSGADVAVQAASGIDNRAGGQVHAAGDLRLQAAHLDNSGGQLLAQGSLTAHIEGVGSAALLNEQGLIRAAGATELSAQRIDNRHTTGEAQGIDNRHTTGEAQGIEGRDVRITADELDNRGGSVVANQRLSVHSAGRVDNAQGHLSAGHTLVLSDANLSGNPTLAIHNTGGTIAAGEQLQVRAARLGLDGQLSSGADMHLALAGDHQLAPGASLVAGRDLALTLDGGDLTNGGTLQAGERLEVRARNITNAATGIVSAATVDLEAGAHLVNAGLIDGDATTRVAAQHLTNTGTGRIYGQAVHLHARGDLLNEGGAVVAAHDALQIGVAGTLTNRGGATLLSLGDLAVGGALNAQAQANGAAQAIHNRSATLESLGDMRLAAAELSNLNDELAYRLVPASPQTRTDYYTAQGYVGSEDVAWAAPMVAYSTEDGPIYWPNRSDLLLKSSPYADPQYREYLLGPDPFVSEHHEPYGIDSTRFVPDTYSYGRHSPIWQALGMEAPAWDPPGRRPQPQERPNTTLPPDPEAMAEWQAKVAPWVELNARVAAMRAAIRSQLLSYDITRSYTETAQAAEVTASAPGQILSGGDLHLQVTGITLNQDSAIVAGGLIQVEGGSVINQSTEVDAPIQRSGTVTQWTAIGRDCDPFGDCDIVYGWRSTPYAETIAHTAALASVRFEQETQPQAPSLPPAAPPPGHTPAATANAGAVATPGEVPTAPGGTTPAPPPAPGASAAPVAAGTEAVRIGAPGTTLPTSSLFRLHPGNTTGYLVETDPRFTDQRQWLGSDFMLAALSIDPATAQKRLGDGFYEQRLVREQVLQLTGQRFLGDFTSDEQQYQALMTAGATFAQAHQLRPGIALSAAQLAALTSDIVWLVERTVTLPDGSTTQALVPQLYVRPQTGDLQPGGALIAGRDVALDISGDLLNAGATIAGRRVVQIDAANVDNLGGLMAAGQVAAVSAVQDIRNVGGTVSAGDALLLDAGRDLAVQSTTAQGSGAAGVGQYASQVLERVAALYVSHPSGVLLASAGRDVSLTAAAVQSAGDVQLQAGRNLTLDTVGTRTAIDVTQDSRNYARVQQSEEIGTRIQSEGGATLLAGQDLSARAAQVQAQGALDVQAGRDVDIEAGEQSLSTATAIYTHSRSLFGSRSTEVRTQRSHTDAVASSLGGQTVNVGSGQDTRIQGSSVIGDQGLAIAAGRDVAIGATQTTSSQNHFEEHKSSGLFASGAGITLGKQQHSTDLQTQGTGAAGSTVGTIAGDVNVTAGQTYRQTGSDVLAPGGDVNIQAQAIEITEARVTEQTRFEEKRKQSGLSVGLGGGVVGAAQGIAQTLDAMGETGDARMKALGAAAVALRAKGAVDGVSQALAKGKSPTEATGVSLNISVGSSKSQSTSHSASDSARGSTVQAGGDVNLIARGAGADSDILVRGSEVRASDTVRLNAEGDIDLLAAQNTATQSHQHSSRSGSIGVGVGANGALSVNASASKGSGQGTGEDSTHTNTRIEAGHLVRIESGQDTTLQGAVVQAPQVQASVGGDLTIESPQDTSIYHENSRQSGGSISLGAAPGASLSSGSTRIQSDYASANEQSAIRAGDGGFQVEVQRHTELIGGAITSTDKAVQESVNRLSTGTLRSSHLQNSAHASAESSGVSISSDLLTQGKYGVAKTAIGNALSNANESGSSSSQTLATVSGARIIINDEAAQQALTGQSPEEAVASLNRNADAAHLAAQRQDAQAMKQAVEAERAIRQELVKAVTVLTDEAYRSRMQATPKLIKVECPAGQNCVSNPELLVRSEATKEEIANAPADSILAVNGILNDEKRGAELAFQNSIPNEETGNKPTTLYLMHIAPASNTLSELLGVAYEKILESADYGLANFLGYTNAAELYADLTKLRDTTATISLGHSRGTLVQSAAFTILNRPGIRGGCLV